MPNKRLIRITIVVVVVALILALAAFAAPALFDTLLAMHGL